MSDSKGKGKVQSSKEGESESGVADTINNLLSSVASSASGLAKSAFAAPSSNELSNASSSSVLGAGKAQPSSSTATSTPAYAESSKLSTSTTSYGQSSASQPQGLRTHQTQHASAAESEFSSFLDTIPPMEADSFSMEPLDGQYTTQPTHSLPSGRQTPGSYPGTGADYPHPSSRSIPRTPPTHASGSSSTPSNVTGYKTVQEAQQHDGEGVLDILGKLDKQERDYFEPQTIEQEIEEWRLTPDQVALAKRLAVELHVPSAQNPAQMVPRAFQDSEKAEYLPEEFAQDSYGYLGEVLPANEAKSKWIEQWEEVLNRYQDEVWGGMAHLVKEAKEEIKQIEEGTGDHEPVALRRLGMVLSHIAHDTKPKPGRQLELEPESEPENPPQRQLKHWTKAQEIAHREAAGLPKTEGTGLEAFQTQLEIMNAQTKRREEQIARGGTNGGTYPLPLLDEGSKNMEEGKEWKDPYTRAYSDTVLDSKREDTAKSLDRVFRG